MKRNKEDNEDFKPSCDTFRGSEFREMQYHFRVRRKNFTSERLMMAFEIIPRQDAFDNLSIIKECEAVKIALKMFELILLKNEDWDVRVIHILIEAYAKRLGLLL